MVKIIVDKIDGHIVYLRYFEEMDENRMETLVFDLDSYKTILPKCEWFTKTIESWYWFDSNECRNYDEPQYNCLMQSQVKKWMK